MYSFSHVWGAEIYPNVFLSHRFRHCFWLSIIYVAMHFGIIQLLCWWLSNFVVYDRRSLATHSKPLPYSAEDLAMSQYESSCPCTGFSEKYATVRRGGSTSESYEETYLSGWSPNFPARSRRSHCPRDTFRAKNLELPSCHCFWYRSSVYFSAPIEISGPAMFSSSLGHQKALERFRGIQTAQNRLETFSICTGEGRCRYTVIV